MVLLIILSMKKEMTTWNDQIVNAGRDESDWSGAETQNQRTRFVTVGIIRMALSGLRKEFVRLTHRKTVHATLSLICG
jgi:hypothetical protein